MNKLIVLAVVATTVVVHSEAICNITYDINDSKTINQQYDNNPIDCTNNIKCKNAVAQFARTADKLTSNEVLFIINKSNEEFKFDPNNANHAPSDNFNRIMGKFTPICQRYTDVMAHKHYLQHLLFDGTLNDATIIIKLTVVIIKLQFMANSLQTAQMESDGNVTCVNFTPSQYITIYYSRLPTRNSDDKLDAMCLLHMRTRNWQTRTSATVVG